MYCYQYVVSTYGIFSIENSKTWGGQERATQWYLLQISAILFLGIVAYVRSFLLGQMSRLFVMIFVIVLCTAFLVYLFDFVPRLVYMSMGENTCI